MELNPKSIAKELFSSDAKDKGCYQIVNEGEDALYIFEVLLTIYLDGLCILFNNFEGVNMELLEIGNLLIPRPWIQSVGFDLKVNLCDEDFSKYYCKVLLKEMNQQLFREKDIEESYHFVINGREYLKFKGEKFLNTFCAIFKANGLTYKITFDFIRNS